MNATNSAVIIIAYFGILVLISWLTSRKTNAQSFFTGDKKSPWPLIAFGMIGASLSGVTFISIPGWVHGKGMTYMAVVLGYFIGYIVVARVLLPLYYKLGLTSIYAYLGQRFGRNSHKTGSSFFLLSRILGASFRLYLVAEVLDLFLFKSIGLPYWLGIVITIALIWIYTFKGGIKTIIWTDTLQTAAMLIAVGVTIFFIRENLQLSWSGLYENFQSSEYASIVHWKNGSWGSFAFGILNGALITIVMTGLDQDMMQKNLSCKNLKDSQKNMFWFSVVLIPVNFIFLALGVLLYEYAFDAGFLTVSIDETEQTVFHLLNASKETVEDFTLTDQFYPRLAAGNYFPPVLGIVFLIGLIAAAYSSADSALTSLTTSFCIDILEDDSNVKKRRWVHLGVSVVLIFVILLFKQINNRSVVQELFTWAGYTYGPLLGLFAFGLLTKFRINDRYVPLVAIVCPLITILLKENSEVLFNGYKMGFEVLAINGCLTFIGLWLIRVKKNKS